MFNIVLILPKNIYPVLKQLIFPTRSTLEQLKELLPNGPDVGIEAVGCHYTQTSFT